MRKVIVTGATGMIGVALIRECIKNNVEVLAIVRKQSQHLGRLPKSDLLKLCECNLDTLESIPADGRKYDVLYHFAWEYTSKENRDNPMLQERNIKYALDAVRLASRLGCRKFIGAGSQAEYGRVAHVITPDTEAAPLTAYGIAKYAAGKLCGKLCEKKDMLCIWAKIFSVYGRYDNEGTMLSYAIDRFLRRETARFSAATQMWDYLHESDAGKIFFLLGERAQKSKVYCIAGGESKPLRDFIIATADNFGEQAVYEFSDEAGAIGLWADISELIQDTGYKPQMSFEEGVKDMIAYRRKLLEGDRFGGVFLERIKSCKVYGSKFACIFVQRCMA